MNQIISHLGSKTERGGADNTASLVGRFLAAKPAAICASGKQQKAAIQGHHETTHVTLLMRRYTGSVGNSTPLVASSFESGAWSSRMMAGEIPMPIVERLIEVATNTKLPTPAINVFALFASSADEAGNIAISTVPEDVGASLGLPRSTVYRAYKILNDAGYVEWSPTRVAGDRRRGLSGSMRIALPGHS
jgi:DNA-binding transcriptional ArsR family regulator